MMRHFILKFKSALYILYLFLIDTFVITICRKTRETSTKHRILIVRLDAIGDFVIWQDSLKGLFELYPPEEYELTLLGNKAWSSLAKDLPYFKEVWEVDRHKFCWEIWYRIAIIKKVRKSNFSTVIQPTFSREFLLGDALIRSSSAEEKIGLRGDLANSSAWQYKISNKWYTRLLQTSAEPRMELVRNAEFIRALGLEEFKANLPVLTVKHEVPSGVKDLEGYYVIFPGASWSGRQWPVKYFAEIANLIHRETGWTGIICGGPGEEELGNRIIDELNIPLQNWCGKTSLSELASIIANAMLLVANETGAIHIAAAVSTPSISILGGGHYGRFMPYRVEVESDRPLPISVTKEMSCYNCNWNCIYKMDEGQAVPCIADVSVEAVWYEIRQILNRKNIKEEK